MILLITGTVLDLRRAQPVRNVWPKKCDPYRGMTLNFVYLQAKLLEPRYYDESKEICGLLLLL